MSHSIPLIRSAVLFPLLRWLNANGRSLQPRLDAADLGHVSFAAPEVPIPLASMLIFFRDMVEAEGADIAARAIASSSFAELGAFGQVVLGAPTPRAALQRVACALRHYSTHELLALQPIERGLRIEAGWSLVLDEDMILMTQQFTAALVRKLCMATAPGEAGIRRICLAPHPNYGVDHLRPWLGCALVATPGPMLALEIDDDVLDAPLRFESEPEALPVEWGSLIGDGSFGYSVRALIAAMADERPVAMARVAQAAGMSARSFQRALHAEGTSFRRVSDIVRRERTLQIIPAGSEPLSEVAHQAGYAAQSSLSRAVRRWTGAAPLAFRERSLRD